MYRQRKSGKDSIGRLNESGAIAMASSIRITCPGCNQEFLVSPQFERLKIAAKCPFCENEFAIADGKNVVHPSPILLVK
jgi:hypothetical protein